MPAVVLILAEQPVIAALIGVLVELAGFQPVFAEPGEQATDAIQRVSPRAVVAVDLALDSAHSDLLFGHAAKRRVGVTLFGPANREAELAHVATDRGVSWFTIPTDVAHIAQAIEAAAVPDWRVATHERRHGSDSGESADGARSFLDVAGTRWMVYDRRRTDRRTGTEGADGVRPVIVIDRLFVNDAGHRRSCEIQIEEAGDSTQAALELQLARAVQI